MKLNFFASQPHYYDHIVPIWHALPAQLRGSFYCDAIVRQLRPECQAFTTTINLSSGLTLVASYHDYRRTLGQVIYMEHGIGHTYSDQSPYYAGGKGKDRVVLFLNNNADTQTKNEATYPNVKQAIIGTPKLDNVPHKPITGRNVCVAFHWDCFIAPETRSAYDDYKGVLMDLSHQFDLCLHAHPKDKGVVEAYAKKIGVPFIRNFKDVMDQCDVYVNDNSSTMYEWLATSRPVVVLNSPKYRKDVHHGLRFWDNVPGEQVDRPEELAQTIERALTIDGYELERMRIFTSLYPYHPNATQRAIEVLTDFMR